MEIRIGGKFKICKRLGQGAFGAIYMGVNLKTNEDVAIKLERQDTDQPMLLYEAKLYEKLQIYPTMPTLHWAGTEGEFNVMVLEMLGPSIFALHEFCEYKFSPKTVMWLGMQMVARIENFHAQNFIHRDIKPENFLIGHGKKVN